MRAQGTEISECPVVIFPQTSWWSEAKADIDIALGFPRSVGTATEQPRLVNFVVLTHPSGEIAQPIVGGQARQGATPKGVASGWSEGRHKPEA
jgi:hypothetical protein